jgi:isopenicillin-N epimerase
MSDLGWDNVRRYNHQLATWAHVLLCQRWSVAPISPLDGSLLGSMATCRLPAPLASLPESQLPALQQRLFSDFHLEVPIMHFAGQNFVRPCCQVYNEPREYEQLADVIATLAREM